jgi:hypothetical protein
VASCTNDGLLPSQNNGHEKQLLALQRAGTRSVISARPMLHPIVEPPPRCQHPGECLARNRHILAHIDYILYIGGLKPIEKEVIYECLQLQQLQAGLEPRPHRGDGHQM